MTKQIYQVIGSIRAVQNLLTRTTEPSSWQEIVEVYLPGPEESFAGMARLSQSAFDFWDNEDDAYYDTL